MDSLDRVRMLLQEHPTRAWPLAEVAERAGCSIFQLIRAFRRRFHETPHRYLVRCRVDLARRLLADTDVSVTDLCWDLGFESLGTFSARFRELVGWSPTVYRARVRAQRTNPGAYIPGCYVRQFSIELKPEQFSRSAP